MEPAILPPAIAESCLRLARELDLLLTGIDLKETPDGDYYCFEVNPCPGFLYYEKYTRQPISTALASLLHRGLTEPIHQRKQTADARTQQPYPTLDAFNPDEKLTVINS